MTRAHKHIRRVGRKSNTAAAPKRDADAPPSQAPEARPEGAQDFSSRDYARAYDGSHAGYPGRGIADGRHDWPEDAEPSARGPQRSPKADEAADESEESPRLREEGGTHI